jgi:hypothetical protein
MKVSSITIEVLPIFILLSVGLAAQRTCRRRAPPFTDCSSTTGECNFMFDTNNLPRALPIPPPNTRTCYRTCHDTNGQCRSVPTVINEQKLQIDSADPNYKVFRIFSPNYNGGSYRKSTICRYRVQCSPGQIISYSVLDFDLEGSSTCSSGTECLDYVEINYQDLATRQRFCGGGETGEVHIEGSNELTFEFVSNRQTEKRGFKFFVNCIDPSTDVNGLRVGAVVPAFEPSSNRIGNFNINPCSEPPNTVPRPLIFERPSSFVPSTLVRRYVVQMFGFIYYNSGSIRVHNAQGELINTIRGILRLEVTNRFETTVRRYCYISGGVTFNGYGILEVDGENANFYQQGVDPVFQPTREESSSIIELERTINRIIGNDFFDVVDQYDEPSGILDIQSL